MSPRYALMPALIGLLACGSAADKKLTEENIRAVNESKALTGEEVQLLQGYVLRASMAQAFSGGGKTGLDSSLSIREAIEQQRKWIYDDSVETARQKAEAEAAVRRYEAEVARVRGIVSVTPTRKSFTEQDYDSYVRFQMVIKNNGDKPIRGFKGYVRVTDLFGDLISRLEIREDAVLAAGAERVRSTAYSYNQFMDRDRKLRFTEFENMKFFWEPEIVIFTDGSEIVVPEAPDR